MRLLDAFYVRGPGNFKLGYDDGDDKWVYPKTYEKEYTNGIFGEFSRSKGAAQYRRVFIKSETPGTYRITGGISEKRSPVSILANLPDW